MIELFFWPTPNGMKPLIFLHEVGLEYELTAVDINKGDQFTQEFLEIAPTAEFRQSSIMRQQPPKQRSPFLSRALF